MKQVACRFWMSSAIFLYTLAASNPMEAQIAPDGTLSSQVNRSGSVFEITGGSQAGGNLFHSFREFSVPNDNTAFFNNGSDIVNIISRVTGGSTSNINGLIRANGNANLVLINPNGIQFGPNAQLNIGGSFLGSTADSLVFEDGTVFSAINPQAQPLLTVSVPVGLQMGANPGSIRVQGSGHRLTVANPIFSPVTRNSSSSGLRVRSGQTLALVGGDLVLDGGVLTAESGRIELGSATGGSVSLLSLPQGWTLGYAGVPSFGNIELRSQALADASVSGGSIYLQGRQISLSDGSLILIQNQGSQPSGAISINAAESLTISGTNADGTVRSSLTNETVGIGRGGDIVVSTGQLVVDGGGTIVAKTFSPAPGGNVTTNASESVRVAGASSLNPSVTSAISTASFGSGNAGNNTLSTQRLSAIEGGILGSSTFGTGDGGNPSVTATDSVEIIGVEPNLFVPSALTAATFNVGRAGNLTVNTSRLTVRDGGRIDACTFATGNAGNVTVNASEFVEVKGTVPGSRNPSLISSSANVADESLRQVLGLPTVPSGDSGNAILNANRLSVTDGALVTTRNEGLGSAGNISINASSIVLDNEGSITAELGGTFRGGRAIIFSPRTREGAKGGDITISTQQLVIRGGANIFTATFSNAPGGNIIVNASESVQVIGASPANPNSLSFIGSSTFGTQGAGNISLSTGRLTIFGGGLVSTGSLGAGDGGDVTVNATEAVEVIGVEPRQLAPSLLGVSTLNAGDAGNLTVNAPKVVVRDGGRLDASTAATGDAGSITINASESVEVSGTGSGDLAPTLVSSAANLENDFTRQIFGLPPVPSGNAGDVTINTGQLNVANGAQVTARNQGLGNGGKIRIDASSIFLDNGAGITASTVAGRGGSINLQARESVRASGYSQISNLNGGTEAAGDLTIETGRLVLSDGSFAATTALGQGAGGNLTVRASESVEVVGNGFAEYQQTFSMILTGGATLPELRTGLFTGTAAAGASGNLTIATQQLNLREGGFIATSTFGTGKGGDLAVRAARGVELSSSGFASTTSGSAQAGNMSVDTSRLLVRDGAAIATSTLGSGAGGNLTIKATESVELRNTPVNSFTPTGLFTNSIVGTGKAGKLEINTQRLSVREGAAVSTQSGGVTRSQTIASGGVGGDLIINASEAIDLAGTSPDGLFQSVLSTATLSEAPAGNLKLVTGELSVRDGAVVAVSSQGTGNTGSLDVVADSIFLSEGFLSAATAFGQGGNINLRVRDSLQMRRNSQISATAGGTGDGGNIAIDVGNFLVLLEKSNLFANAFQGRGGNIQINARGIFICGNCQISASSRLGIDGTVELNTLEPDTKLEVIELPQEVTNPEEAVALSCQSQRGRAPSEFTITGRGGLPPRPSDPLGSEALVPFESAAPAAASPASEETDPAALPPPARGWYVSEKGTVVLSARPSHATPHSSGLPSSECHAK
ncbi:MAG: filamentous hemagglutinin N-terminal domain-containing protein [Hydrococcus sp. C42_A2020_068]|nr:filamentous hemagglutinin N-terminal domain-containing protein [Hydrococcus sp. C42_A2020_068]